MAHTPKVSVVLCTYNGARFLAEQLYSILNQSHPLHEVVIVDDCSTDATPQILADWAMANPIIKWHRNKENLGYNKNFEKALSLAGGDILAIADQDDVWHVQKIEILIQNWPAESPLIYSDSVLFSRQVPSNPLPNPWIKRLAGKDPRQLALFNTISGHAMLIRKDLLGLALPFNPQVYYDWWLAVVAIANGGITYHPQVLVYQRQHPSNSSMTPPELPKATLMRERSDFKHNLEQFLKTPNLEVVHQQFFETLYRLWSAAMEGKEKTALFRFLLRHRKVIYSSKKNRFRFLSHLKRSFRYAFGGIK